MAEAVKVWKVKGLGDIYQAVAPLDEQIKAFRRVGILALATPEEVAQIRIAGVSYDYSKTNVAPIGTKGKRTILSKDSILMNPLIASLAVNANMKGNYFKVGGELYELVEQIAKKEKGLEPEDRTAIVVSKARNFPLTPEMPETRFLLGRQTVNYFDEFTKGRINFYGLDVEGKGSSVGCLWFESPECGSSLSSGRGDFYDGNSAFGVLRAGGASARLK